ncbi:MAG: TonB-dependent receptor [Rikenellaceae bacterium]
MKIFTNKRVITVLLCFIGIFLVTQGNAQTLRVNGVVKNSKGADVIGATAIIKGTNIGAVSDINGKFSLESKSGDQIIVSYLGFQDQLIEAATNVTVTLEETSKDIDDVVVIGYGSVRRKEVTGAVASLSSEAIDKSLSTDLGSSIQGMISGVSVVSESDAPGTSATIMIRGVTSVNGDNTPLYVVDGMPYEGDPLIAPNEIETIDVLKDAASCAIYGTRGAAGVILITTKKGVEGKLKAMVNASYGVKQITSSMNLMNSVEQTYVNMLEKRGTSTSSSYSDMGQTLDLARNTTYFQNETNLLEDQVYVDLAATQTYSATVSGGANGLTYSVMTGYTDQRGNIINSGFNRFNSRANLNYSSKKLKMNISVGMSDQTTDITPTSIILQCIKYYPTQKALDSDAYVTAGGEEQNRISDVLNSFFMENNQNIYSTFVNYNVSYELFKGFTASGRIALTNKDTDKHVFVPYSAVYDTDGVETSTSTSSYVSETSQKNKSMVWDFGMQYKKNFNKHHFTALATITGEEYNFTGFTARQEGVADNDITVLNGTTINPEVSSSNNYTNKLIGTLARLQYDWASRYLISASIRVDGSSKFAPANRWGVFPSASAAWNISDEKFFRPLTRVINNFKLRASYGTTGNQNFSAYSYDPYVSTGYDNVTGTSYSESLNLGTTQTTYANEDVKWETSKQYNIGIDLGLFNNRLTFTAEYYKTDKSDMLFPVTMPGSSGTSSSVTINVGDMTNEGYELAAAYRTKVGKVNLNMNATFSTNKNVVTKITGDNAFISTSSSGLLTGVADRSTVTYLAEGYSASALFVFPTNGVINTEAKLAEYQKLVPSAQMGDLIYVDTDGDGALFDDDDRVYAGSGLPDYEIGFNLTVSYRNFDLYTSFYSALGHELANGARATAFAYGRHKDLVGAWSTANTDSQIPTYRGDAKSHDNYRGDSDLWIEDGSYLRLKNITLGYNLPKKALNKMHMTKLRVYVSALNIWTLTEYTGFNPEVGGSISTRGMDFGTYPSLATYMCGLNLSF